MELYALIYFKHKSIAALIIISNFVLLHKFKLVPDGYCYEPILLVFLLGPRIFISSQPRRDNFTKTLSRKYFFSPSCTSCTNI